MPGLMGKGLAVNHELGRVLRDGKGGAIDFDTYFLAQLKKGRYPCWEIGLDFKLGVRGQDAHELLAGGDDSSRCSRQPS